MQNNPKDTITNWINKFGHPSDWFRDFTFRSLVKNVGWLLSGNTVATILVLFSTAIKTHVLGITKFGLLSVIVAYVTLIQQFASFGAWQALIKFGAEALKQENYEKFLEQIKICFILDIIGAVSGTIIAITGVYLVADWQGWSVQTSQMTALFSLSILFNLSGSPIGILRLLDRFDLITAQNIITAALGLIGSVLVFLLGGGIDGFLIVMLVASVTGNLVLIAMTLFALKKRRLQINWRVPITEWKPFVKFSIWTYATASLDIPVQQLDIIIASAVISMSAAGIYKIIKQVIVLLSMLADPIYQAVYPQFVSMVANHDSKGAVKYAVKIGSILLVVTGVPALLLGLSSYWWLGLVFGKDFASGAFVLCIFLMLRVFAITAVTIHPLFTAMGYVKQTTIIVLTANVIYLVLAWNLGQAIGLLGLAIAYGLQITTTVGLKAIYIARRGLNSSLATS
jgi:O-antigen/teichoic acid export membrane protein